MQNWCISLKSSLLQAWFRQTKCPEMITKEGSSKIVNLMTHGSGVLVLRYGNINRIVKMHYFQKSSLLPSIDQTNFYNTKGRDRFHWAATPPKPYKVRNIWYMTYMYGVLYFLNLSLKHFFPTENGNFCEFIQIRRPLSFRVLTCRACPIDVQI